MKDDEDAGGMDIYEMDDWMNDWMLEDDLMDGWMDVQRVDR